MMREGRKRFEKINAVCYIEKTVKSNYLNRGGRDADWQYPSIKVRI
jgi:hypothetical protein